MPPSSSPKPSLYDHLYTPEERQALEATPCNDLSGEIKLLKVRLARFLEAQSGSSDSFVLNATFMNTVSLVAGHIAYLVNTQLGSLSPLSEIEQARQEGLELARECLGLLESGDPREESTSSAEEKETV